MVEPLLESINNDLRKTQDLPTTNQLAAKTHATARAQEVLSRDITEIKNIFATPTRNNSSHSENNGSTRWERRQPEGAVLGILVREVSTPVEAHNRTEMEEEMQWNKHFLEKARVVYPGRLSRNVPTVPKTTHHGASRVSTGKKKTETCFFISSQLKGLRSYTHAPLI
ncbi:hypothetical protein BJX68DRAFT_247166 [Aspergillus pseudodeflectus]|uniref:Uncharacterized protein n=1 Tax=Aspergillus pseudodeflectus TaxID=176178 RepID=A0ABR4JIY0_9EURO